MNTTPMREFNHFPIIEGKVGNGVKFERIRRITGYLVGTVDRSFQQRQTRRSPRPRGASESFSGGAQ